MANDLIRFRGPGGDGPDDNGRHAPDSDGYHGLTGDDTTDDNEQWDTPPDAPARSDPNYNTQRRKKEGYIADAADRDAADARSRGDEAYAVLRETDAAEHRQTMWDWGDFRTWAIIFGMCAAYLLMSAVIYYMPHGRHAQNDGAAPVPTIRVY